MPSKQIYAVRPLRRWFPPDEPMSPHFVALLVHYDEIRFALARTKELLEDKSLRERSIELIILTRQLMVALADGKEHADAVGRRCVEILDVHGDGDARAVLVRTQRSFKKAWGSCGFLRDTLGAHIDAKAIEKALHHHCGGQEQGIWFGRRLGDCSFKAAHAVVFAAMHIDKTYRDDPSAAARDDKLAERLVVEHVRSAHQAAAVFLELVGAILTAFARQTGMFVGLSRS